MHLYFGGVIEWVFGINFKSSEMFCEFLLIISEVH